MKRLFVTLFLAAVTATAAFAQFADVPLPQGMLKRSGGGMQTLDKTQLTAEQVMKVLSDIEGVDYTEEWNALNRGRERGVGLIVGGSITGGLGLLVMGGTAVVHLMTLIIGAPFAAMDETGESLENFKTELRQQFLPWYIGSGITAAAGTGCLIAGIPLTVSKKRMMNAIVDRYNGTLPPAEQEPGVSLTLGPTRNGFGLALNF